MIDCSGAPPRSRGGRLATGSPATATPWCSSTAGPCPTARIAPGCIAWWLAAVRRRRLPVFILWGRNDRVIPLASAEALIGTTTGTELHTVSGDHGWLIADPNLFAEVLTNVIGGTPPAEAVGQ